MSALSAVIPGEGAAEPILRPVPPHPDRASAIRPLPTGERLRGAASISSETLVAI